MIWQLMKRDPAWRWMPYLVLASAALNLVGRFPLFGTGIQVRVAFDTALIMLLFAASYAATIQQGDTRFQATLPVTVRQVYLTRVLSMLGAIWLPVAVSTVIAVALPNPAFPVMTLLVSMSFFTLEMVALQSAGICGFKIPVQLLMIPAFAWKIYADLTSDLASTMLPAAPLICWLALAAIFLRTWRTVPASFQSSPLEAMPAATPSSAVSSGWMQTTPWMPVLRSVFRFGGFDIFAVFILMAISTARPFAFIFAAMAWPAARPTVRWLFAIPVPRRSLLAATLLPVVFTISCGYLASVHLPSLPTAYTRTILVRASQDIHGPWIHGCKTSNVLPPLDFWVVASNGNTPLIQAPWGEEFQPPVFRKAGFDIYNPFAVGCGNSERFLDWQFNRASVAVYGHPFPRNDDDLIGHVVITSLRTQFVTVAAILGIIFLCMSLSLLNDWHRFRRLAGPMRVTIMSLLYATGFGAMMLDVTDNLNLAQWLSWILPQSLPAAVAVTVLPLALLYWLLDVLFRQIELVNKAQSPTA